jgi:hypothetical protein
MEKLEMALRSNANLMELMEKKYEIWNQTQTQPQII